VFADVDCGVISYIIELEVNPMDQSFRDLHVVLYINRKAAFGLILTAIVIVILMFDTVFELLLELTHLSFELIEHWLDMLIEHIFHTDLHDTQIIVFYLMLSIAGYALYKLYKLLRTMPRQYREFKENLVTAWAQLKKEISAYWQDLPPVGKIKWLMGLMTSITCVVLWIFI
jgi:hypothetical protein